MNQNLPQDLDRESLNQLSKEELVEIIIEQSRIILELQKTIKELQQEVERLKVSRDLDSKTSSKPPSGIFTKRAKTKKHHHKRNQISQKRNQVGNQDIKAKPVRALGE